MERIETELQNPPEMMGAAVYKYRDSLNENDT
jgi:hypothetical protein